jgi:hypothetical protein
MCGSASLVVRTAARKLIVNDPNCLRQGLRRMWATSPSACRDRRLKIQKRSHLERRYGTQTVGGRLSRRPAPAPRSAPPRRAAGAERDSRAGMSEPVVIPPPTSPVRWRKPLRADCGTDPNVGLRPNGWFGYKCEVRTGSRGPSPDERRPVKIAAERRGSCRVGTARGPCLPSPGGWHGSACLFADRATSGRPSAPGDRHECPC